VDVGTHPFGITVDAKGEQLYTANVESDDVTVVKIDPLNKLATFTVPVQSRPYAVSLALNDTRLFVTNQDDSSVSVIDTQTLKEIAVIEVGEKPEGIATHPDDRRVYVANWFDGTVTVIDGKSLKVVNTITVGEGSRAFGEFFTH
jgi:YVTN family beta-propeller protein